MLLSADCKRKQESTENIRSSNGLPSRVRFLLISPDSHLDPRADICWQNRAHVDLLLSTLGSPEDFQWGKFSHVLFSRRFIIPPFSGSREENSSCVWNSARSDDTISVSRPGKGGRVVLFSLFSSFDSKTVFTVRKSVCCLKLTAREYFHFYPRWTSIYFVKSFLGPKQ